MQYDITNASRRRILKNTLVALSAPLWTRNAQSAAIEPEGNHISPTAQRKPIEHWKARQAAFGDVSMEYFEFGNPAGVPLVLVHGFPDSPHAWQGVMATLDPDRFRIVLPYLRGFGRSTVKPGAPLTGQQAALSRDIIGLLDALRINTCHLVGHDWGAKAAYGVAVLAPTRLLTLTTLATAYDFWGGGLYPPAQVHGNWYQFYFQTKDAQKMLAAHADEFCEELWHTWSPTWHFTQEEFLTASSAWTNPQFASIVLSYYRLRWGGDAEFSSALVKWQSKLDMKPKSAINTPTTFIQGAADACDLVNGADGQDSFFTTEYKRVILPGAGHFPHREQPELVSESLMARIDSHSSANS